MDKTTISIGRRLETILDEAEKESQRRVNEAQQKADKIIADAKTLAEEKRASVQRGSGIGGIFVEEEKKAKVEAEKVKDAYDKKAKSLQSISKKKRDEAVELVVREVLPQ
jgi:vacuolar-type H+-ATPase subunit H